MTHAVPGPVLPQPTEVCSQAGLPPLHSGDRTATLGAQTPIAVLHCLPVAHLRMTPTCRPGSPHWVGFHPPQKGPGWPRQEGEWTASDLTSWPFRALSLGEDVQRGASSLWCWRG